jgi:hypothetical protein
MIIISSKIRLDAMSKVISFSISDRYLDKLRTLYPAITDNLTDGLESSLGNSLDANLDDGLDDRVKTLIESWVDGLLDERLDATVGKLLTSLCERMARLEERLDDSLDDSLDDMERLLRLQREASIATSPLPPIEEPSPGEPVQPAIGTLPTVESVEPISTIEPGAIATVRGDTDSSIETVTDAIELTNREKAAILGIDDSNLSKWVRNGSIPEKYGNKCRFNENKTKIILI